MKSICTQVQNSTAIGSTASSRKELTISPAEVAHRSCSACLIGHIAMKIPRKLYWDPINERFKNDDEANRMLSRSQRAPWGYENIPALARG